MKKAGYDHIVCNGDMIQGGPQPHETVQLLREMNCSIVMGNSDAWLMTGIETNAHLISEERRKKLDLVREWSLSKLDEEDRAFINAFQATVTVELGRNRKLLAFHGSPTSFDQFLLPSTPEDEFQEILKPYADGILTGGHIITGIDGDSDVLEIAREKSRGLNIQWDEGLAFSLPYSDASYDRVVTRLVIHHLFTKDKVRAFQEIYRVLKPAGELYVLDFGAPYTPLARFVAGYMQGLEEAADNFAGRIPQLIKEVGFDTVTEIENFLTVFGPLSLWQTVKG
jgi:SAM-dependent methyltransferase